MPFQLNFVVEKGLPVNYNKATKGAAVMQNGCPEIILYKKVINLLALGRSLFCMYIFA